MKKLLTVFALAAAAVTLVAGTVNVAWDTYVNSDGTVNTIKVYAVKGTNTVFTAGNANANVIVSTAVTNNTVSFVNLPAGAWTFTATAATTNGLESANSNVIWTNVLPGSVINFRFGP